MRWLLTFWRRLVGGPPPTPTGAAVAAAMADLRATPLSEVIHAGQAALDRAAPQVSRMSRREHGLRLASRRARDQDLAWLLTFSPDGYVRQAGLDNLRRPPQAAFQLVAIALRLNDWVPQVRQAARAAGLRLLPATSPEVIAQAASYICARRLSWGRWEQHEADLLDAALSRPDAIERLAETLRDRSSGSGGALLKSVFRFPTIDAHLPDLAEHAALPPIRAVALEALIAGRARWPVGSDWVWVDKAYGLTRRIVVTEERPLGVTIDVDEAIRRGARDRSAMVRKIAADALYVRRGEMPDAAEIARSLLGDRSGGVRDRADFLLRNV